MLFLEPETWARMNIQVALLLGEFSGWCVSDIAGMVVSSSGLRIPCGHPDRWRPVLLLSAAVINPAIECSGCQSCSCVLWLWDSDGM